MSRGKRCDETPKLNKKKVVATIIAFIVIIMIIVSIKRLLTPSDKKTKEVSSLTTYISVYEDNKWGVIDNKGNIVLDIDNEEMVIVPDKNKSIFICTYDIDYDNETYKTKVINEKGEEIFTEYKNIEPIENTDGNNIWYEKNVLKYKNDDKFGLINFSGKELLKPEYDNIYALEGIENSIIIEKSGRKGLVNASTGEVVIEPKYTEINTVADTYEKGYIVKNEDNKYGIIAGDKSKILEEKYDDIKKVASSNYYVVVENGILQVVDTTSKVILNSGYDSIEQIELDNFIIIKNGKYGVINSKGNDIILPEYENLKFAFSDYFIAQKNGKYGIISKDGDTKVDFNYENITYIKTADFFQADKTDLNTDIIDREFNVVLENVIISELNIDKGYIRIRKDDDYKYYNCNLEEKSNKEILTTNTLFLVKENGKYGYENKDGQKIVDCIYDDAKEQNEFGYCAVNKNGLWGALKSDGTVIVEPSRDLSDCLYIDFVSEWNRYNDITLNVYTK